MAWHVDYYQTIRKGVTKKSRKVGHDGNKYKSKAAALAMVKKQKPLMDKELGKNRVYVRFLKSWK